MRLKTELWVKAYLRRRQAEGAFAAVLVHGHDDAGAIFIRIATLDGRVAVYGPAPASLADAAHEDGLGERLFQRVHKADWIDERGADDLIARQRDFDPDLWVVDVEDRTGAHGLDGWLATGNG